MHPLLYLCPAAPPLSGFNFDSDVKRRKQKAPGHYAYKHHKLRDCVYRLEKRDDSGLLRVSSAL